MDARADQPTWAVNSGREPPSLAPVTYRDGPALQVCVVTHTYRDLGAFT